MLNFGFGRALLDTATRLGYEREFLRVVRRLPAVDPDDIRKIVDQRIRDSTTSGTEGVVLIPLFPGFVINEVILCTLAHAFRTRGYEVVMIGCDDGIPVCSCDNTTKDHENSTRAFCQFTTHQVCSAFGFDPRSIDDILPEDYAPDLPADILDGKTVESVDYRGIGISELARSNVRKYYRRYNVDPTDGPERVLYSKYLRTAAKLVDGSETIFRDRDVKAVVAFDDHYVYGGTPLRVAAEFDIPAYSVDVGYINQSLVFGNVTNRNSLPMFTEQEVLDGVVLKPLSRDERTAVTELMKKRAEGKETRFRYSPQTDISVGASKDTTLVGMFTNLSWDAALEIDTAPFPNMFDWIATTINSLGGRNDVELVVRSHPAEAARGTNEPVADWIDRNVEPLPSNVTVIQADSDVNTYNLISEIDLCLVYTSIVGLESVFRQVPTIVGGDTHYSNLGITYDPEDGSEYHRLLETPGEIDVTTEHVERAERYARFFFFEKHVPFPFFDDSTSDQAFPFKYISHDRIGPGNPEFDRVVDQIVNGQPVLRGSSDREV